MRWRSRPQVDCPQCGSQAPADARWCGTCGAPLRASDEAPTDVPGDTVRDGASDTGDGRRGRLAAAALVAAVLAGLLVVQSAEEPPVVPAGFTSRGDGARTGRVSTVPVPAPSGVAWREAVDLPPLLTPGTGVIATTRAPDGRELVVVHDPSPDGQRITSHDAADGTLVATTMLPLGSQPYGLSTADGLLAHRDLTSVTLVDLTTGARRWRVEERLREDAVLTTAGVVGVPADAEGLVLQLLALEDGAAGWRTRLAEGGRLLQLLHTADTVVVRGQEETGTFVLALDPVDGRVRWRLDEEDLPPPATFPLAPIEAAGGHVVVPGVDGLLVVDVRDGSTTSIVDDDATGGPAVVTALGEDVVVRSDGGTNVVAYDLTSGARRWATPAIGAPVLTMAVGGDVVAVQGDSATTLLDVTTGEVAARVGPAGDGFRLTLGDDGVVLRVTSDGDLEAAGRGGTRWQVPTVAIHLPDLATDGGRVAVTTPDGVQVHEVDDGERRWAHAAFEPSLVVADALTPPVLAAGRVFIAPPLSQPPDRGGLLSLFADTGIVDWARDGDRVVPRGIPVVDRDLVVLPVGSQLLGFDRTSGRRALVVETSIARTDLAAADGWFAATDARRDAGDLWVGRRTSRDLVFRAPIRTCAPPVLHDDVVIVVDHLDDIVARELETGEQPWGERARGSACRPLSLVGDVLVALVHDRELLAVGLGDGETAWRLDLPAVAAGAPVVAGDQLLVPTLDGRVTAWTVAGTTPPEAPTWSVDVGGIPAGAVAVDGTTVLVVTREGELVGLR